jgi:hypothetical protein
MNEDIKEFNAWLNAKDGKFYGMVREYIISIGHAEERERIIKLLEENTMTMTSPLDNSVMRSLRMSPSDLIALIKGDNND